MVEAKLDKILTCLDSFNKRLDTIESKLETFSKRMDNIETNFDRMNERFDDFEEKQKLENKTFTEALDSNISKKEFEKLAKRMEYIFNQGRKQHLMVDLDNKRLNLLIYGFEENKAWETKEQLKAIIDNFLLYALQIDSAEIHLVDVHRLPRHSILFRGKQVTRPIIIKLPKVFEKKIMDSLPKLKAYNQKRGELATSNLSIFISEHLPKEFQNHKKSLMSKFKEAGEENKSTYLKASVDGECCLLVEDAKIPPFE